MSRAEDIRARRIAAATPAIVAPPQPTPVPQEAAAPAQAIQAAAAQPETVQAVEGPRCGNIICELEGRCMCGAEITAAAIEAARAAGPSSTLAIVPRNTPQPPIKESRTWPWAPVVLSRFLCNSDAEAYLVRKRVGVDKEGNREKHPVDGFFDGRVVRVETTLDDFIRELQGSHGKPSNPKLAFYTAGVHREMKAGDSRSMGKVGDERRSRSKADFPFPEQNAMLVIDSDELGTWGFERPEQVVDVLAQLGLDADCGASPSASSFLEWPNGKTGLNGLHTFYSIDRGDEIPRVIETMHKRAWINGYGRILVGSDGKLHVRSIVDLALAASNQNVFEFGAVLLDERLRQHRTVRPYRGTHRQLKAADILPLTDAEEAEFERAVEDAKAAKASEAKQATDRWLDARVKDLPAEKREAARKRLLEIRDARHKNLPDDFMVQLNDGKYVSVADIKANPGLWNRKGIRDPLEPDYGPSKATIFTKDQEDGRPKIISRAHGNKDVYFLDERPGGFDPDDFEDAEDSAADELGGMGGEGVGNRIGLLDEIALVKQGMKVVVLMLDGRPDKPLEMMSVQAARDYFANRHIVVREDDKPPKLVPEFNLWLKHPARKSFEGIDFDPSGKLDPSYFNLWTGLAVEPVEGDCSRYLAHARDNICAGNEEHYEWLIRWMAHTVQRPCEKPGTAIVLRGPEGAGKNVCVEGFGSLFGPRHYIALSRRKHLVGDFNAHLAGRMLVFSNEAVWGGNKDEEGTLKSLISDSEQSVEKKGFDVVQMQDWARHILATNEDWAVPAGLEARRWLVLDVGAARKRDTAYFGAIKAELDNGGREALLHFLLNLDLAGFDARNAPQTDGLLDQKLRSLSPFGAWWHEVLTVGFVDAELPDAPDPFSAAAEKLVLTDEDGGRVTKGRFNSHYHAFAKKVGRGQYLMTPEQVGSEIHKFLPDIQVVRPRIGGDDNQSRVWCYVLPSLEKCRKAFEASVGQVVPWLNDTEVSENA